MESMASFDLFEGDFWYTTIVAPTVSDALEIAIKNVQLANYNEPESTIWIEVRARCVDTEEEARADVPLDPTEPPCSLDLGHEWNPKGVWGRGGGIVIANVCVHCKLSRITDTWAHDPHTGRQGLTSVRYEANDGVV